MNKQSDPNSDHRNDKHQGLAAASLLQDLEERGLIQQCSSRTALAARLERPAARGSAPSFYLGIDPTAPSLHCGHLLPVLLAKRLALAGQQPLLLVGSGTAKIGDPSGKSQMRAMLSEEAIAANAQAIRQQLAVIFGDSPLQPIWLDNRDWLEDLGYIAFLRDIGKYFSVNRMLSFESCKQRLERGLSFIEFNYQLLQSYDYLKLFQDYGCRLQIGGDDQWGNMVAGTDLIRRYSFQQGDLDGLGGLGDLGDAAELPQVLTVPLVLNSSGQKMGKTERGAVFIDPQLTSPFDFFQYWRNSSDADVQKFLLLFTFLPLAEIRQLCAEGGAALNRAKEVLAYELTAIVHGPQQAEQTQTAVRASFGGGASNDTAASKSMPGRELDAKQLAQGIDVLNLYVQAGLCASRNEARRLIQGGGASINGHKVGDAARIVGSADANAGGGQLVLQAGKKRFFCFAVV